MSERTYELDAYSTIDILARATMNKKVKLTASGLSGTLRVSEDGTELLGGTVVAPLASLTGGDPLKDRELHKFLSTRDHAEATLELEPAELNRDGSRVSFDATGTLTFQGRTYPLTVPARGTLDEDRAEGTVEWEMKITDLDLTPPKLLFLKVKDEIELSVKVVAKA